MPADRIIDGVDMAPLLTGGESHRDTFFYYMKEWLCAARQGPWKLHVRRRKDGSWLDSVETQELYNLETDIGETVNVYQEHPEVAARMQALIEECRHDLGDEGTGQEGAGVRPPGKVNDPKPLLRFDPEHPYYIAYYDLTERG
jgi:arylsulfatase A-like enzyme